jgi:transcriptional regulator NrdR family protein
MKCPKCSGKTSVKNSRAFGKLVTRHRTCLKCGARFVTHEEFSHYCEREKYQFNEEMFERYFMRA